jgi:hypothetical protein
VKGAAHVLLLLSLGVAPAHAGEVLQTLKAGSWLCTTPEAYDSALAEERRANGDLEELKRRLLAEKLCMYADTELVEKIMVPFARVLERQGSKVKVIFTVEFQKRFEVLHRLITRVTYGGWTEASNLEDKEIL